MKRGPGLINGKRVSQVKSPQIMIRHDMETSSSLLAPYAGNAPVVRRIHRCISRTKSQYTEVFMFDFVLDRKAAEQTVELLVI